jgi:hypothetical protein
MKTKTSMKNHPANKPYFFKKKRHNQHKEPPQIWKNLYRFLPFS